MHDVLYLKGDLAQDKHRRLVLNCICRANSSFFACSGIDFSALLRYYVFAHSFWKIYVQGKLFLYSTHGQLQGGSRQSKQQGEEIC
jgi:hypothetical protein